MSAFDDYAEACDVAVATLRKAPEPPGVGTHREVQAFLTAYRDWHNGPRRKALARWSEE